MNWDDPQEMSAFAGEYVLGTLSDAERLEVEAEVKRNPPLAAEVAQWQDRLLGLTRRAEAADPSEGLWQAIDKALPFTVATPFITELTPSPTVTGGMSPGVSPGVSSGVGSIASATARPAANDSFWSSVTLWKSLSGLAVAACLVLATLLVANRTGPPPDRYMAVLQSPDKLAGWVVQVSTDAPLTLVPLTPNTTVPEGRALQFWTKIDGAAGPTSLGLVKPGQSLQVELSKLPGVAGNQLFEITLEPPNGSPINKPTGPVLFIGRSVKV